MNLTIKDLSAHVELNASEMTPIAGGAIDYFLPLQPVKGESTDDARQAVSHPVALNLTKLV